MVGGYGRQQFGGYGHSGFGAQSIFSDNTMKRRRMREMILSQSSGSDNERESKMKKKENKKKQNLKMEQQKERELDGDDLFFDDAEFEFDELQINENVNPTPNRCVLINNFGKLIEICLNDQHLEIIKLNQKKNKNKTAANNDNYDYDQTNISFAGYEMMDFGAFDSLRYEQMNGSQFKVENIVSNVQFLSI